jgi:predicted phage baseplate assembly protein
MEGRMSDSDKYSAPSKKINARVGDYEAYVTRMQKATLDYVIPDGKYKGENPLKGADLTHQDNFLNGIYCSWSAVLEVLTFYQDRIVNEGYINTATEQFSIRQLASGVGQQPDVMLSAKTWLAFTLLDKSTSTEYIIPKGTQAQNIPDGGVPAIFETIDDFVGKPSWNQMAVYEGTPPHTYVSLRTSSTFCCIVADKKHILPHTHLYINGQVNSKPVSYFVEIIEVLKNKNGTMMLSWGNPLAKSTALEIAQLKVFWLPESFKAFGYNAAKWSSLAAAEKEKYAPRIGGVSRGTLGADSWTNMAAQSPDMNVTALSNIGRGTLFLAGSAGIYQSSDSGQHWNKLASKLVERSINCLCQHEGVTYAGGDNGAVFISDDEGKHWQQIRGKKPLTKSTKEHIKPGMLPAVTINTLAALTLTYKDGDTRVVLFSGTAMGIFYTFDDGQYWHQGDELFSYHEEDMPNGLLINHIQIESEIVTVSTNKGIYFAKVTHDCLPEKKANEIKPIKASLIHRLFHIESAAKKRFARENAKTNVLCSITVTNKKELLTLFSTERGLFKLVDGEWLELTAGLLQSMLGEYPVFTDFITQGNIIIGISNLGIYLSKDAGESWALHGNEQIYSLPNLNQWAKKLKAGKIPEDFHRTMAMYGYFFSSNVKVSKGKVASSWLLSDINSAPVSVVRLNKGLSFSFPSQASDKPTKLTLFDQRLYIAKLMDDSVLDALWFKLFATIGIALSKKNYVEWNEEKQAWILHDEGNKSTYLVNVSIAEIKLFRVNNAVAIASGEGDTFFYGEPLKTLDPPEWPCFTFASGILDLAQNTSPEHIGDAVYLKQESPWTVAEKCNVELIETAERRCYGKTAKVLALHLDSKALTKFNRRDVTVYAGFSALNIHQEVYACHVPITGQKIKVNLPVARMKTGHKISVQGRMAVMQFGTQQGEDLFPFIAHRYDGKAVPLARDFLFAFANTAALLADLNSNILTLALYKVFEKKKIQLHAEASLYTSSDKHWVIVQEYGANYILCLDEEQQEIEVYREYHFPIVNVHPDHKIILYRGEKLVLENSASITEKWLASKESTVEISEIVELAGFSEDGYGHVTLLLKEKLAHLYDRDTLQLRANVVEAVHGETVKGEVLGSAVQGKPFQTFPLRRGPLTIYQDEAGNTHNFLSLYVRRGLPWDNGKMTLEKWSQIESIFQSPEDTPDYQVIGDAENKAAILFGSGEHGRIPPLGVENILADYRCGGGRAGNQPVGAIKVLRSKPRGVRKVFNPVAATGGADAMSVTSIRQAAPRALQDSGVIVAPSDYLFFSRNYPGVLSVSIVELEVVAKQVILLCVQLEADDKEQQAKLCQELAAGIKAKQSNPALIKVVQAERVYFKLGVQVFVNDIGKWPAICAETKQKILWQYGAENRDPGDPVESSAIIASIQAVAGVVGVDLTDLSVTDTEDKNDVASELTALPSRYDETSNTFLGAQVLLTSDGLLNIKLGEDQ